MSDSRPKERSSSQSIQPARPLRVEGLAHAKLNLFLEILGRRPDGFHELVSVFQEIDLADRLSVEITPRETADVLQLDGDPIEGDPGQNLVLAAVRAVRREALDLLPVRVHLNKRIPSGAGLGGGSSDAAFVLRALSRLHPGTWTEHLQGIAAALGSDVAFFLVGGTAVCRGRGERVEPVTYNRRAWYVVAAPTFRCSTAAVYAHPRLTDSIREVTNFLERFGRWPGEGAIPCFNRLEASAFAVAKPLALLRDECSRLTGLPWYLTGSGSALFTPCSAEARARAAAARLREIPKLEVFVSSTLASRSMD